MESRNSTVESGGSNGPEFEPKKELRGPPLGILMMPPVRDAAYLSTLEQWGALPEVLSVPEAALLIGKMCGQNPAALQKLFEAAIVGREIRFWGLSDKGGWIENMERAYVEHEGKPRLTLRNDGTVGYKVKVNIESARLHIEAMGVNPADVLALLVKRGRAVPDALRSLLRESSPPPGERIAEPQPGANPKIDDLPTSDQKRQLWKLADAIADRIRVKGSFVSLNKVCGEMQTRVVQNENRDLLYGPKGWHTDSWLKEKGRLQGWKDPALRK